MVTITSLNCPPLTYEIITFFFINLCVYILHISVIVEINTISDTSSKCVCVCVYVFSIISNEIRSKIRDNDES